MFSFAQEIGATAINFQPVSRVTREVDEEFWIGGDRLNELEGVIETLVAMKRQGAPIVNSDTLLRAWPKHFTDGKAPKEAMPCRVGLRNFMIRSDGEVESCWMFPSIGNVTKQSPQEIWASPAAVQLRRETTQCEQLCLFTCLSQKTILDKVKMAKTIFLTKRAAPAPELAAPVAG